MLDQHANRLLKPLLRAVAKHIATRGWHADTLTLTGFSLGICAMALVACQAYILGMIALLLNRLFDGLDGALARETQPSDAGGFLDIVLDFIIYAGMVLAFAISQPDRNAIAACTLIFAFMGTGSSFLAFAIMAAKHRIPENTQTNKAMHYIQGITEGTETIAFFILCCLFPPYFPALAYGFATLCGLTTATRIIGGYQTIQRAEQMQKDCE